jgi:hypothetical protein
MNQKDQIHPVRNVLAVPDLAPMRMPILVSAGDHPWVRDFGFQGEPNQEGELSVNLVDSSTNHQEWQRSSYCGRVKDPE